MTFIEAAADILDREGKPLHAREITEKAVDRGILSHVGKTPVQTMSAQLSAAVLKGTGPFTRVRPGVFALAKWQGKPPGPKRVETPRPDSLDAARSKPSKEISKDTDKAARKATTASASIEKSSRKAPKPADATKETSEKRAADEGHGDEVGSGETAAQKRRKRRRKKASKSPGAPVPSGEAGPSLDAAPPSVPSPALLFESHTEEDAEKRALKTGASRHPHLKPDDSRKPATQEHYAKTVDRRNAPPSTGPSDEIADHVEKILRRASRPLPPEVLLEELGIPVHDGRTLLDALLTSDAFERERRGRRPRFVKHKSGYGLLEREVSAEITALEHQAAEIRRRLAQLAERQVLKKLRALPMQGFVRTMIVYLERSGFGAVKPVQIRGLDGVHLSVQDRRRGGTFRTAVMLRRDAQDYLLTERAVMDLRGAMHHFDAMGGIIFTTGQIADRAAAEGRIANLPPVAVVDGETLAQEMVRLGIGVKERAVSLPTYDDIFFAKIES